MERLTLSVPGLHCDGCIETVCGVLGRLGGVADVEGDLDSKTVTVLHDPDVASRTAITATLEEIGFPAAG